MRQAYRVIFNYLPGGDAVWHECTSWKTAIGDIALLQSMPMELGLSDPSTLTITMYRVCVETRFYLCESKVRGTFDGTRFYLCTMKRSWNLGLRFFVQVTDPG